MKKQEKTEDQREEGGLPLLGRGGRLNQSPSTFPSIGTMMANMVRLATHPAFVLIGALNRPMASLVAKIANQGLPPITGTTMIAVNHKET